MVVVDILTEDKKEEKKRISVTLTDPYLDGMDHLVNEGLYLSRGEIILAALRILLKARDIPPFHLEAEGEPVLTKKRSDNPEDETRSDLEARVEGLERKLAQAGGERTFLAKVVKGHRVTIHEPVREFLGIEVGDLLSVTVREASQAIELPEEG